MFENTIQLFDKMPSFFGCCLFVCLMRERKHRKVGRRERKKGIF